MGINKADIVTEFGDYYVPEGQNMTRLKKKLTQGAETTSHATPIMTDATEWRMSNASISSVIQGFQKTYTPKGDATFTPNTIKLRNIKVDTDFYPDDIKGNWLGFLASNSLTRAEWPISRYMAEEMIIPKIQEDLELQAYFTGTYVAPTPGVAGASNNVLDGLKTLLDAGIGVGRNMNSVALNTLTPANIFDEVEDMAKAVTGVYRNKPMKLFMSPSWKHNYLLARRDTHGTDINFNPDKLTVDYTNFQIVSPASMEGSNAMFITPQDNLYWLRKWSANATNVKVEEAKREVVMMTDWWEGLGFGIDEAVWYYQG